MISKQPTKCCGLAHVQAWEGITTLKEIQDFIDKQKKESETLKKSMFSSVVGERALFCITMATESNLEKNLETAGFKHIATIPRRYCYENGNGKLKMWLISW
jgi:hypothetical protein